MKRFFVLSVILSTIVVVCLPSIGNDTDIASSVEKYMRRLNRAQLVTIEAFSGGSRTMHIRHILAIRAIGMHFDDSVDKVKVSHTTGSVVYERKQAIPVTYIVGCACLQAVTLFLHWLTIRFSSGRLEYPVDG